MTPALADLLREPSDALATLEALDPLAPALDDAPPALDDAPPQWPAEPAPEPRTHPAHRDGVRARRVPR